MSTENSKLVPTLLRGNEETDAPASKWTGRIILVPMLPRGNEETDALRQNVQEESTPVIRDRFQRRAFDYCVPTQEHGNK